MTDLCADLGGVSSQGLQDPSCHTLALTQEAKQDVLRTNVVVACGSIAVKIRQTFMPFESIIESSAKPRPSQENKSAIAFDDTVMSSAKDAHCGTRQPADACGS